jgi:hypothetical protein
MDFPFTHPLLLAFVTQKYLLFYMGCALNSWWGRSTFIGLDTVRRVVNGKIQFRPRWRFLSCRIASPARGGVEVIRVCFVARSKVSMRCSQYLYRHPL